PSPEVAERPAVAVKVENNPVAYPLSGLDEAEVVFEELVEGGLTRFMAIYHCTDAAKAGPIRSARMVDPAIMSPYTQILAAAGGNDAVRQALDDAGVVLIDEEGSTNGAYERVPRDGLPAEHTLYGDVAQLREAGAKEYEDTPTEDLFKFGDLEGRARDARSITLNFPSVTVTYEWDGDGWARSDNGQPHETEDGDQIVVDNVIIEEHTINNSEIQDVTGAPSPEIEDVTGSGRAILFRDKKAIEGRWVRKSEKERVVFETDEGDEMVLAKGTTWIHLLPDNKGDVKGSFSYE
ncbi:MAG: DUF3048 domain-containing protein, partial [Actinomycetota bacterium]|nr:DUF3048 domain-containing protein [Actinomycetota bacterium]